MFFLGGIKQTVTVFTGADSIRGRKVKDWWSGGETGPAGHFRGQNFTWKIREETIFPIKC